MAGDVRSLRKWRLLVVRNADFAYASWASVSHAPSCPLRRIQATAQRTQGCRLAEGFVPLSSTVER
jgi:hypothetical protein